MEFRSFSIVHGDHQVSRGLLAKALRMIESDAPKGAHVVDFGRVVGFNDLVEVSEDDEFYEMERGDRPYKSRFVKNRLPTESSRLTVIWRRVGDTHIQVISAYFTDRDTPTCPDEPGNIIRKINKGHKYTQEEIAEALEFWSTHAFVEPLPICLLH